MDKRQLNTTRELLRNFQVGLITSVITQPFEVLRTNSISSYKSVKKFVGVRELWKLSKIIYSKEGLRGFFRGGALSILKNGISCTVFFTGLHNVDKELKKRIPKRWLHENPKTALEVVGRGALSFLNAGVSKIITTVIVSPIILLKTRFEVAGKVKKSIMGEIKSIYNGSGVKGFYKGLFPTLLRDVPWSGFQYSFYSLLMMQFLSTSDPEWKKQILAPLVGGLSSVAAVMLTFPFDNLRVRMQI